MPPVGFEPTISTGERPQTYALDRADTGTGGQSVLEFLNVKSGGSFHNVGMLGKSAKCFL